MSGVVKAIGGAIGGVVKAVGSIVNGIVSAVGSIVSGVLNFVMSPFLGLFGVPDSPDMGNQNASIQGVTLQRQGSDQQIPIVYGYRKIGGIVTFAETGSDNNKYLWVAYVLGEGPVEGLREIYINDIPVGAGNIPNLNAGANVPLTDGASGKLANRTVLQFANGNADNVGTAIKAGIFAGSPSWTTDMSYRGLAVVFARYEWITATDQATSDANPFSGSIPTLQVTMLGRKITRLTSGTPESNAYDSNAQYSAQSYSSNPAEIILDYLRNPRYGKGLKNSDIDWTSFKLAAAKFNQTVTYTASGVTGPIQTLHAVVDTSQTIFNNVKLLLQQCRSYLPYSRQGTYMLKVDDAGNVSDILSGSAPIVRTFTKDNIIGGITYSGIERTSKFNQVVVTYCDPDQSWSQQTVSIPTIDSTEYAQYLAEDGGRIQKGDISLPWITNFAMAQDMGRLALQKSRWQDSLSFTATSEALDLMVGDCVYVQANILRFGTDPNAGAINWRIVSTKINNDYSVSIGCVRNQNNIYPHVSVNDLDYKTGVYIPKGVTRYYPPEPGSVPIGLKPPGYAPTDPTDPLNPRDGLLPRALTDAITIYDVKFAYNNNQATATLIWSNPVNPLATQVIFSTNTTTLIPGVSGGNVITVDISGRATSATVSNLNINTDYITTTQVVYVTGDRSTTTTSFRFNTGSATQAPVVPGFNLAQDYFKTVTGATVTQGTFPSQTPNNPRQVSISLTQDMASGTNSFLNSVVVYYKPSANPKWLKTTIPVSVTPGSAITFNLTVGSRVYPSIPGSAIPNNVDAYDFIFRFGYTDGRQSKWQYRAMNTVIEYNGSVYQYSLFASGKTGGQSNPTIYAREDASTYVPAIATPSDTTETRNITISAYSIRDIPTLSARIYINPPIVADRINWVGVRVYRHKAGVSGTGDYVDFTPATYDTSSTLWSVVVPNMTWDETWEFVVVPLVNYGSGTVEAFNGQYLTGYLHNRSGDADYPSDSNWIRLWTVNSVEALATAKAKLATAIPKAIRNDTYFDSITAATLLTSSVPRTPRAISFSVKTSTANGANGHVAAIRIFYKFNSNVYWKSADYATSSENTVVTFASTATTPAMDLGAPQYPVFPYLADNYDFYFRIVYTDGTQSKYAVPYINVNIEDNGITTSPVYAFNPFGAKQFNYLNLWTDLTLEANAPPGAVANPKDLTLNLSKILDSGTGSTAGNITFYLDTPVAQMLPYYAGVRIYTRDVSASTITYTTNNSNQPIANPSGAGGVASQPIIWDKVYAYVVTPMVWYQGALTPANNSWYWSGAVHNRTTETTGLNPYPNATTSLPADWRAKSAPQWINTTTALTTLVTPIVVSNPVITLSSASYITGTDVSQNYYQIKYIKPANTTTITIYRRACLFPNGYQSKNYSGVGRWETMTVNDGGIANGSTVTVNLREATAFGEFSAYWDPTKSVGVNLGGISNYLYSNNTQTAPTNLALQNRSTSAGTQLLIVVNQSGGASTQSYLLNLNVGIYSTNINTSYPITISSNSSIVNTADYDTITTIPASTNGVTLQRKLTEARSPVSTTNLIKPGTYSTVGGWSYPSVSPTII